MVKFVIVYASGPVAYRTGGTGVP
eukprot:gene27119-biopygen17671